MAYSSCFPLHLLETLETLLFFPALKILPTSFLLTMIATHFHDLKKDHSTEQIYEPQLLIVKC